MKGKNKKGNGLKIEMTRRDFVGGTLIGSGVALLSANAPGALASTDASAELGFKLGKTMTLLQQVADSAKQVAATDCRGDFAHRAALHRSNHTGRTD